MHVVQEEGEEEGGGSTLRGGRGSQPANEAVEASPAWERGTVVQLFGLMGRPELNETAGVVEEFDEARGQYAVNVELLDSKPILIKPTNLRP